MLRDTLHTSPLRRRVLNDLAGQCLHAYWEQHVRLTGTECRALKPGRIGSQLTIHVVYG